MSDERLVRITGWVCDDHGLAFDSEKGAREHDRVCGRTRVKTLAELQSQMDKAERELKSQDQALSWARSRIAEASANHRRARQARDAAKDRAEQASRLWAQQAQRTAKTILEAKA